jgi:hypothetical protein
MSKKQQRKCVSRSATRTIPELEQSKAAVLNTLASAHYKYAIARFIAWYCDEPRLAFRGGLARGTKQKFAHRSNHRVPSATVSCAAQKRVDKP